MKRNNYQQDFKQALEAARAARGSQGYQVMVALLEAQIEQLKDQMSGVDDSELPAYKHSINILKTIVKSVEADVRIRPVEAAKTGGYTDI